MVHHMDIEVGFYAHHACLINTNLEDTSEVGTELLGILCVVVGIGKWDGLTRLLVVQGVVLRRTISPGIISGLPYTNSADDECKSSLGVTLKPNRTHDRITSVQRVVLSTIVSK